MKHVIDEKVTYKERLAEASAEYKARRDQILALSSLSGWQYLIDYWENVERTCMQELRTAPLDTTDDKKNLYTVRGEYNIAIDFLSFLRNLKTSKDREK
jgi:hypothetical protein